MSQAIDKSLGIQSRYMLASLEIKGWSGRAYDAKASAEVANAHNAPVDSGRYNKMLVARDALAERKRNAGQARKHHYDSSLEWRKPWRLLPGKAFTEYTRTMREYMATDQRLVKQFLAVYPDLIEDARRRLNGMFDPADYPAPDSIGEFFSFENSIEAISDPGDFRVALQADEVSTIKAEMTRSHLASISTAQKEIWGRVHSVVRHMADKLKSYDVGADGKVDSPFRDTLVSNISDLLDIVPGLNVTEDPNLTAIAEEIRREVLGSAGDPQALRDSKPLRAQVAESAEAVLERMAGFMDR
jgi:hypothetical protein